LATVALAEPDDPKDGGPPPQTAAGRHAPSDANPKATIHAQVLKTVALDAWNMMYAMVPCSSGPVALVQEAV